MRTVMLSSCTDTLLTVDSGLEAGHRIRLANGAEEDGLELVHAGIGEQKSGI
jgi:hypothetical protein